MQVITNPDYAQILVLNNGGWVFDGDKEKQKIYGETIDLINFLKKRNVFKKDNDKDFNLNLVIWLLGFRGVHPMMEWED